MQRRLTQRRLTQRRFWTGTACLLVATVISSQRPVVAGLSVARLKNVVPVVQVGRHGGRFSIARARQALRFGNVVRTGPRGKADIVFANGTIVAMNSNTQISIDAPETSRSPLVIRVFGALAEVWVRKRGNTQIHTVAAIVAARNTEFLVRLPTENATEVIVTEGTVDFYNPLGAVVVPVGQASSATVGSAPTPPRQVDVTGLLEWTADVTSLPIDLELGPAPPDAQSTLAATAISQARQLVESGQVAGARTVLQPAANAGGPASSRALTMLGWLDLRAGDLPAAQTNLQSAIERDARLSAPRALLALVLLNANRVNEAVAMAREATLLDGRSSQAQSTLALALFFAGQTREAERAARRAGTLDPLSPLALLTQGRVALSQLKTDEARDSFAQAAALAPNLPLTHIELGQADLRLDRLIQAEKSFRRALELQPNAATATVGLGIARQRQGRLDEARALYQKVLLADANNTSARANYAQLLLEEGKLNEARAELQKVTADDPESGIAFVRMSEVALYQQNLSAAQEFALRGVQILPRSAPAHYQLGRVFLEQERTLQAEQQFRQAVRLDPQLATARYALGFVQDRTERSLLLSSSALQGSITIGSPATALSLQNLQTPGARERIQALAQNPTVARVASRSFGDTQIDGILGQDDTRNFGLSHLRESDDRRTVYGLNAERRETEGARANADDTFDRASFVFGHKVRQNPSGMFLLGDYERQQGGTNNLRDATSTTARFKQNLPRLLAGLNLQSNETTRTNLLIQIAGGDLLLTDLANPLQRGQFNFDSTNAELRHDHQVGDRHRLVAGLTAGVRKRHVDSFIPSPPPLPLFSSAVDNRVKQLGAYLRDEYQANERLRVIGELQFLQLDFTQSAVIISPPNIPSSFINRKSATGLPYLVFDYRAGARSNARLRARRLMGLIRDFQLLQPTDVFSLSREDLPTAGTVNPRASGRSVEMEFDHTFNNASFVRFGVYQQDLRNADFETTSTPSLPADARVRGARLSYEGLISRNLAFVLRTDLASPKNVAFNSYVPLVPRFVGAVGLQYLNARGYLVQALYIYQSGRYADTLDFVTDKIVRERLGGSGLLSLRAGKRTGLRSNVFIELNNAFDKRYDVLNTLQPGRQLRFGSTRRF